MFWKRVSENHCFCFEPATQCTFTEQMFCRLYVWMCIMFWKNSSESHCFCLKPTIQCAFTDRILCSIICLNVYNVLKNSFASLCFCLKPKFLCTFTERIICSIVCLNVYNVLKIFSWKLLLLLEAHHSVYIHRAHILFMCVWMCIMFWKYSPESYCFCLKPTTQCTFTERILHSLVCLNVSNVLKNSFWKPLLLLRARHSVYFHRANILFDCMFEYV